MYVPHCLHCYILYDKRQFESKVQYRSLWNVLSCYMSHLFCYGKCACNDSESCMGISDRLWAGYSLMTKHNCELCLIRVMVTNVTLVFAKLSAHCTHHGLPRFQTGPAIHCLRMHGLYSKSVCKNVLCTTDVIIVSFLFHLELFSWPV